MSHAEVFATGIKIELNQAIKVILKSDQSIKMTSEL